MLTTWTLKSSRFIALLLVGPIAGCLAPPEDADESVAAHSPHYRPGEESQGVDLQGDVLGLGGIKTTSVTDSAGRKLVNVRVYRGELIGSRQVSWVPSSYVTVRGTAWKGALLRGVRGAATFDVRIDNVVANPTDPWKGSLLDGSGSTFRYDVSYVSGFGDIDTNPGPIWSPLCKADAAHGTRWALPVKGTWDALGGFQDWETSQFTFACTAGAAFKCQAWGYLPWKASGSSDKPMSSVYNACIRMARADYCGTGKSFTVNGTRINLEDTIGIRSFTDQGFDTAGMSFESAWRTDGAVCLSHARWANLVKPEELCGDSTTGPWTYTNAPGSDDVIWEVRGPRMECNSREIALQPGQPWQARGGPPLTLTQSFVNLYPPLVAAPGSSVLSP